jgi:hypothetical protein
VRRWPSSLMMEREARGEWGREALPHLETFLCELLQCWVDGSKQTISLGRPLLGQKSGVQFGRPRKLNTERAQVVRRLLDEGGIREGTSYAPIPDEIGNALHICPSTIGSPGVLTATSVRKFRALCDSVSPHAN